MLCPSNVATPLTIDAPSPNILFVFVTVTPLILWGIIIYFSLPIYTNSPFAVPLKSASVAKTGVGTNLACCIVTEVVLFIYVNDTVLLTVFSSDSF